MSVPLLGCCDPGGEVGFGRAAPYGPPAYGTSFGVPPTGALLREPYRDAKESELFIESGDIGP